MKYFFYKSLYTVYYLLILLVRRWHKDQRTNSKLSIKFIEFNNKKVLKKAFAKKIKSEEVAILLPHCVQNYACPHKITSDIDNCKSCGICKIGEIRRLKELYKLNVKVATGGTLARMFLKEHRPKLVLVVACERDLVSGIYDAFPMACYGIFNKRINGPCFNTDFLVEEIEGVLKELNKIEGRMAKS